MFYTILIFTPKLVSARKINMPTTNYEKIGVKQFGKDLFSSKGKNLTSLMFLSTFTGSSTVKGSLNVAVVRF